MRRRHRAWAPVLLLCVAACTQPGVVRQAATSSTCQEPSAALVHRIAELAPAASRFTVLATAGRKDPAKPSAWWVGVRFTSGGSPTPKTGIWVVGGGLDGRGTLLAVDPVAQQWSEALDADVSASKIAPDEGKAVLACL